MLSIEIITALKTCTDTWSSEEIELTEFVKHVCTGNDITYDHVDNLRVNARLLIEDLHKWTVAKSIEVIGPREVMIYLLDKYGVSFTLPMPKRKKTILLMMLRKTQGIVVKFAEQNVVQRNNQPLEYGLESQVLE